MRQKNHATSKHKKIAQTLRAKKITQPLGTKKIMQPLGTKKSCNLLVQKNHTTSWDQKGPKNSNLSHNQNQGDRHGSPWSCCSKMFCLTVKHFNTGNTGLIIKLLVLFVIKKMLWIISANWCFKKTYCLSTPFLTKCPECYICTSLNWYLYDSLGSAGFSGVFSHSMVPMKLKVVQSNLKIFTRPNISNIQGDLSRLSIVICLYVKRNQYKNFKSSYCEVW